MSERQITIGYMSNDLFLGYNSTLHQGIVKTCGENNLHNLIFLGGELISPYSNQAFRNDVYNLINKNIVDGLIINAGTIFHYADDEVIKEFCDKFHDIPIISIGKKVLQYPSILIDNRDGLRKGIIHLIKDHGYRRIGFIMGPQSSYEAKLRLSTYTEVLEEFGIEVERNLIEEGNFDPPSGIAAMKKLLEKKVKLDAIIASNDDMALGALGYAQEKGMYIPKELAIMGFDDIDNARFSSIPLTTVRQPLFKVAEKAVLLLKEYIEKKVIPEDVVIPTELVIRRSCGCFSQTVLKARIKTDDKKKNYSPDALRKELLSSTESLYEKGTPSSHLDFQWEKTLAASFISFLESNGYIDFLSGIDAALNRLYSSHSFNREKLQNSLSRLITISLPYLQNDIFILTKAESFWHQLRLLIQEYEINSLSSEMMKREKKSLFLITAGNSLISMFDLEILKSSMMVQLPMLNIETCYISLFEKNESVDGYSRLIFGYSGDKEETLPTKGIRYKTKDLLPPGIHALSDWNNLIVDALFFEAEQFGFILLKIDPGEMKFEAIRLQLSSAIKGALMARELRDKENKLKKSLEEQTKQSKKLEKAYVTLQNNQKTLLSIEKMASLGRMTAGIAHEMNTPLAAARASLMELESLITEYEQSIGQPGITDNDYRDIVADMKKSIHIAKNAVIRSTGFVKSVKTQTRELAAGDGTLFKVVPVIRDAIILISHDLKKNNCTVNFNFTSEDITLFGMDGKFSQIITNLLTNAMDAYRTKGGGPIDIELKQDGLSIVLLIRDRGCGIEKDIISKIYEPLFTTKALFEGTGLGLAIVHNIIEGIFEGTIDVESTVGEGTTFIIRFPDPKDKW
ncbi:MAG: substrate-binding domain-containing protein [Spirochaetales bacterium]|nr:substrate-binding domain-containing protein [Spirochaetales bacterium]